MSDSAIDQAPAPDAPQQDSVQTPSLEDRAKIFVRNLDYNITEDSLKETFSQVGPITKVDIKSRRSRSLGYAFIQYESQDHADEAVTKFNQMDLNDRTISVENARPQIDGQSRSRGLRGRGRGRGRGARRGRGRGRDGRTSGDRSKNNSDDAANDGEEANGAAEDASSSNNNNASTAAADGAEGSGEEGANKSGNGTRRGRGRGLRGGRGRGGVRGRGGPRRFNTRKPGPPQGETSETLVFVANIPFDIDDDGLKNIFKDFEFTEAHIVRQERGFNAGKSRGYGFVNLVDTETQKRALESLNGTEIDGRKIEVRVGVLPSKNEEGAEESGADNAATENAESAATEEKKEESEAKEQ